MKKLIKLLSVALITGSTAGSVVACSDVVIRKEQLKTVDTYKLRYAAITFYVDKVNSVNSIKEMISFYNGDEFNQRIVDYGVEGVVDVNAYLKEGTDNIIVIAPDVYSNYKEVEKEDNVEVKYDKGNIVVTLNVTEKIEEFVNQQVKEDFIYAYSDDARKSIEKAIKTKGTIFFDQKKLENIFNSDKESQNYPITLTEDVWKIDLSKLSPALTDNYILDSVVIEGKLNWFESYINIENYLNTNIYNAFSQTQWLPQMVITSGTSNYGDIVNTESGKFDFNLNEIVERMYNVLLTNEKNN